MLEANVFPTKEAGDYLNNNIILLKYDLDKDDPDGILEKYAIKAYPTFVFVDGNGEEFTRFLGGAANTESFIERIENAIKPENSWAYRNEKLNEYIKHLGNLYFTDQATALLNAAFSFRSVRENFSEGSIELYNSLVSSIDSPIVEFMLNNQKEVSAVMGEEQYKLFLSTKATGQIFNQFGRLNVENAESLGDFENVLATIQSNPLFASKISQFFADNFNFMKANNGEPVLNNLKKIFPDLSKEEQQALANIPTYLTRTFKIEIDPEVSKQLTIFLLENIMKKETNPQYLEYYQASIDRLKNPQ